MSTMGAAVRTERLTKDYGAGRGVFGYDIAAEGAAAGFRARDLRG